MCPVLAVSAGHQSVALLGVYLRLLAQVRLRRPATILCRFMLIFLLHAPLLLGLCSIAVEIKDGLQRLLREVILQKSLLALCIVYVCSLCRPLTIASVTSPVGDIGEL